MYVSRQDDERAATVLENGVRNDPVYASIGDLPGELLDLIFAYLRPGKRDQVKDELQACALVCHKWTPLVQPHLFHNLRFRFVSARETNNLEPSQDHLSTVENMKSWVDPDRFPQHNVLVLLRFLTEHAHLAAHIRYLHLEAMKGWPLRERIYGDGKLTRIDRRIFCDILGLLPCLRELMLTKLFLSPVSKDAPTSPPPSLHLSRLELDLAYHSYSLEYPGADVYGPRVAQIAMCFTQIDELCIAAYHGGENKKFSRLMDHLAPALHSLRLRQLWPEATFFPALLQSQTIRGGLLRCLEIELARPPSEEIYNGIQQLVDALGPSLQEFTYAVEEDEHVRFEHGGSVELAPYIDLSACTRISSLGLRIYLEFSYDPWGDLLDTLSSISHRCPGLRRITFDGHGFNFQIPLLLSGIVHGWADPAVTQRLSKVDDTLLAMSRQRKNELKVHFVAPAVIFAPGFPEMMAQLFPKIFQADMFD